LRTLSGPWSGFWIQELVRGNMKLRLRFFDCAIEGAGRDPMGEFKISGMFSEDNGRVIFTKEYGAVNVDYCGTWDGTLIYGRWNLSDQHYSESGDFEIWPDKEDEDVTSISAQIEDYLSMPAG